jgi:hypothetical protein
MQQASSLIPMQMGPAHHKAHFAASHQMNTGAISEKHMRHMRGELAGNKQLRTVMIKCSMAL